MEETEAEHAPDLADLALLSLSEAPCPAPGAEEEGEEQAGDALNRPPTPAHIHESAHAHDQTSSEHEIIDGVIKQALADSTHRVTVVECEELVEKFLSDPCVEVLQFPASFGSYQRKLAHRVGQYHGLQTSTVDYEEAQGRVLAIRTVHCQVPMPRLRDMNVRVDPAAHQRQSNGDAPAAAAAAADKPRLLRRQEDDRAAPGGAEQSQNPEPRTMKERQENYMRAREELGLGSGAHEGGGRGGRGGPGGGRGGGRMDGGRGRKAVFRDKDKDLSDPDYRRGVNRFSGAARFDPTYAAMPAGGIYQVPTYSTEFPVLNRMPSGGAPSGRPFMQHPQQMQPGGQPHSMVGQSPHQAHMAGGAGSWGQQGPPGGVRPPPPPPPPHHASGPSGGGGPGGKSRQGSGGGAMGSRQAQHAHAPSSAQQQQQGYGGAMGQAYPGAQYPVAVGAAAGYMAVPGQAMYGMAAGGAMPAGAVYPPGSAYYGMGMGAVGMAMPGAGAYGYVAGGPAAGMGVGSPAEALALSQQGVGAYPVYGGYPAGGGMYPAAAAQMQQQAAMHSGGGGGMPMRPMFVPFYPQYEAAQYGGGGGGQGHGDARGGYGGYGGGGHHQVQQQQQHHQQQQQHHQQQQHGYGGGGQAGGGMSGGHGHGHAHGAGGGGRGRDHDGRGASEPHAAVGADK